MTDEEKKIEPLSEKEKNLLQMYSDEGLVARERLNMLQMALKNLVGMALYARGLSPATHKLNDKGEIVEVVTNGKAN